MKAHSNTIWQEIRKSFSEAVKELRPLTGRLVGRIDPTWRLRLGRLFKLCALAAGITVIAAGIAIYGLGWENRFTRAVSRYVPYPAAVSWHGFVSYYDYAAEVERIDVFLEQTGTGLPTRDRNRQALGQRLNVLAVERLAGRKKITVEPAELAAEYKRIVESYGGEKQTLEILRTKYGMTKSSYRELIREQLLRTKAEAAWATDAGALDDARNLASQVLREAEAGANFDELAGRYSQDLAAGATGDEALVDVAGLPENVSRAAAAVQDGELISRPLEADESYYVVKRVKVADGKVMVRSIVVKPLGFSRRIASELDAIHPLRLLWSAR